MVAAFFVAAFEICLPGTNAEGSYRNSCLILPLLSIPSASTETDSSAPAEVALSIRRHNKNAML